MTCFRRVQADGRQSHLHVEALARGSAWRLGTQMPQKTEYERCVIPRPAPCQSGSTDTADDDIKRHSAGGVCLWIKENFHVHHAVAWALCK